MCTRSIANLNFRLEFMSMSSHALIAFDNTYSPEISVTSDYLSNIQSLGTFLLYNKVKIKINIIVNWC